MDHLILIAKIIVKHARCQKTKTCQKKDAILVCQPTITANPPRTSSAITTGKRPLGAATQPGMVINSTIINPKDVAEKINNYPRGAPMANRR
jgi:hypothetical protein